MSIEALQQPLQEVSTNILRYFKEFISSDFKRQQAPRRRIFLKTQQGFRAAIDLRKYPDLFTDVWGLLAKPPQEMMLKFGRRAYRAQISPLLRNLIGQYVDQMQAQQFEEVRGSVIRHARDLVPEGLANPEKFAERVLEHLHEQAAGQVVRPLLALLEGPFRENAYSVEDSIYEVESELTEMLCASVATHLPDTLNTLLLTGDSSAGLAVLAEFFSDEGVRAQVLEFFESFAAADAFQELRDVLNYVSSDDELTTYFYFGAIKFGAHDYPLFYIPVTARVQDEAAGYVLTLEPRLYVNKQAIEYIAAEMRTEAEVVSAAVVPDRIIHLGEGHTALDRINECMRLLGRTFDVATQVDFTITRSQAARTPQLRLSNASYLAAFDRSDESLVNDYEALLSSLEDDHVQAAGLFQSMVKAILFEDPQSVSQQVRDEWGQKTAADRLITQSPIPLNEEQIRIEMARRKPGCQFIVVEGPPGTGKSHTITALAFNAIMDHRTVLVVSDKQEALDVVQDKLTHALKAVRSGDDFPNPILRLGKDGTYRGLISGAARSKIQNHHTAQTANMPALEEELGKKTNQLASRIEKMVSTLSGVGMDEIGRLHEIESQLETQLPGVSRTIQRLSQSGVTRDLSMAALALGAEQRQWLIQLAPEAQTVSEMLAQARRKAVGSRLASSLEDRSRQALGLFEPLLASQGQSLLNFIYRIEALRMPVLGYLLRSSALAAIDAEISTQLRSPNPIGLSRKVQELKSVAGVLARIGATAREFDLQDEHTAAVYSDLARTAGRPCQEASAESAVELLRQMQRLLDQCPEFLQEFESQPRAWAGRGGLAAVLLDVIEACGLSAKLHEQFREVPRIDFVKEKSRLESLNTARLAHRLDGRFLNFVENNRATAQALGGVIRQRAQFPVDQFQTLRDAFPCVIAGIRELGEFVPLKTQVFDLLIIDEGSQVSVAQALPAMLRAKQVIVFGDRKQFANVKSHNASNATNASYISSLKDHFRQSVSTAADKLDRLQHFDVKRSILEFVALGANHQEMLRKHFRGYPELISYSSKNFYDGALQAIKVRPVPIEDVIQFEVLEHDGRNEAKRNTNSLEAERIIEMLQELVDEERPPSVAIITPHTEQVALLSGLVSRHAMGSVFEEKLKLKIFSFDTCQGEERDIIIYSMVATRERDVLNYIFPVKLGSNEDENDTLKAQRLNVGFSRAKEALVFVLSKEPEEFRGTIGQALVHFKRLLQVQNIALDEDTDPRSPMEKKVLAWLKATMFFQDEIDNLELIAQFEVGNYLRQLDPTYQHPKYKCDFLLRHHSPGSRTLTNVIIEYDGFEEHFTDRARVNAGNYERYYKPDDVERQLVLESYGYRFLRINRFNLGDDPVRTLDERLRQMIDIAAEQDAAHAVEKIRNQAQALDSGDARKCQKCATVKDLQEFFDPALKSGVGGHGRVCMPCKRPTKSAAPSPRTAISRRRFGRR